MGFPRISIILLADGAGAKQGQQIFVTHFNYRFLCIREIWWGMIYLYFFDGFLGSFSENRGSRAFFRK
jgi:hypothetical protein